MNIPTKSDIIAAGFKMTANASPEEVARCAGDVLEAYILPCVTPAAVTAAVTTDEIGKAWIALTFLRYQQDVEFATRTGGEKKRFEWGEHLAWALPLKATCARRLKNLLAVKTESGDYHDICRVMFRSQLFN